MAAYFVLGIVFVLFAIGLTALGLTRDFPRSRQTARTLTGVAAAIALLTFAMLLVTTEREHPRDEAKAEALEKAEKREELAPGGSAGGHEAGERQAQGGVVTVVEDEYSVKLPVKTLEAGPYAFDVVNKGMIEHDLAVKGPVVPDKTDLIPPGESDKIEEVQFDAGTYKLYCTVPGHEQLGMKTELEVR